MRRVGVCCAGLAALLAAGCSSSSPGGTGTTPPAKTSAPGFTQSVGPSKGVGSLSAGATAPATGSAGTSATSTTSGGGAPQPCGNADLRITGAFDENGGAAGHERAVLVFTNVSARPCTLYGYPGVDGIPPRPGSGQIEHFRRTLTGAEGGPGRRATVTLAPGGAASAVAEASSVPSGGASDCTPFQNLQVTAPNTTRTVTLPIDALPSCDPQIHPVVAGATG